MTADECVFCWELGAEVCSDCAAQLQDELDGEAPPGAGHTASTPHVHQQDCLDIVPAPLQHLYAGQVAGRYDVLERMRQGVLGDF